MKDESRRKLVRVVSSGRGGAEDVTGENNGAAPDGLVERLGGVMRGLARQRLPEDVRGEADAALARLEAILAGGTAGAEAAPYGDGDLVTDRHGVILEANAAAASLLCSQP